MVGDLAQPNLPQFSPKGSPKEILTLRKEKSLGEIKIRIRA